MADPREPPTLRYMFVAAFNEYIRQHGTGTPIDALARSPEFMDLLELAVRDAGYRKVTP